MKLKSELRIWNMTAAVIAFAIVMLIMAAAIKNSFFSIKENELNGIAASFSSIPEKKYQSAVSSLQKKNGTDVSPAIISYTGAVIAGDVKGEAVSGSAVEKAFDDGSCLYTRFGGLFSDGTAVLYQRLSSADVLRLSTSVQGGMWTLWGIIPALLAAVIAASFETKKIKYKVRPAFSAVARSLRYAMKKGVPDMTPENITYDEFQRQFTSVMKLSVKTGRVINALKKQNRRIESLLNNMNEGLVVLDANCRILILNESVIGFFDAEPGLKGQNILRLTHYPPLIDALKKTMKDGKAVNLDLKDDSGKGRVLEAHVNAVMENGRGSGAIILVTDVTAVRRAEQIRSEFLTNASHELKTPLTSINGFMELMETGIVTSPDKSKEYLAIIRSETKRMIELINDILKLSELESAAADTGAQKVSLKLVAQKVCESLAYQIEQKQISVEVSGDVGSVSANPDRMTQLLLNLIDNAVKYNNPGGFVHVAVKQEKNGVSVTVSDNGIGIPKESQARVFERFYRVDKSRSRKLGGTGLGLSIVKHITGLYGGMITLESEPGRGTSIKITLPDSGNESN